MQRFDFSFDEYQRFLERCPFTEEEKQIIKMRRDEKSILFIAMELSTSVSTVNRKIKSICKKISKEI